MGEENSSLFVFVVVILGILTAIILAATTRPSAHDDYIRFMVYYSLLIIAESKNGEGTQAYYDEIRPYLIQITGLYARSGKTITSKANAGTDFIDVINDVITDYNSSPYTSKYSDFSLLKTTNLTSREINLDEEPIWDLYVSDKSKETRSLGTLGTSLRDELHNHFDHSSVIQEALNDFFDLAALAPSHENFTKPFLTTLMILCYLYFEGKNDRANLTKDGYEVTESYLYSYILDMNYEIENDEPPLGIGYDYSEYLSYDYGDVNDYGDDLFDFDF